MSRPSLSLGEIAVRFGCTLRGDPQARVSHVATLEHADSDAVSFLANPKYRRFLATSRAGLVIIDPKMADECSAPVLLATDPYATYARVASLLHPSPRADAGLHPSAIVDPRASIDPTASIGARAVIEAEVTVGARAIVGPGCVVMRGARIGADTRLTAQVTLCADVQLGERCILHPGVVIGGDGFGLAPDRDGWIKVPQVGSVRIGNDVEIGANTTVDRGAIEDTVLEDGVKLDNHIQIGHNVRIGAHTAMAACSGVSGSTSIGRRCLIGGMVGFAGHLTICDGVVVTGRTFVNHSIRRAGVYSGGLTADEAPAFRKNAARFHQLDKLARTVRKLAAQAGLDPASTRDDEGSASSADPDDAKG
jgi:UDP-3-O-[3-hydroxymyristoyl] glucosamine N-acyltransferase